jgi:lipopolysaccharide/colanic/teichoic acid biosynthesis glycosyltransferase
MKAFRLFIKRAFDLLASTAGLIILSPLLGAIAVFIKIDSPGPVFFLQERVGRNKVPFRIIKFRTMVPGAEKTGAGYEVAENDSRITRAGKFLRRWSLDELPQLINIFLGQMSLVGPRPTLLYQVEEYTPRQMRRLEMKPGLTGLAQVSGRNTLSWPERIELDIKYVDAHSLWLDMVILLRTPAIVLRKDAVYTDEQPPAPGFPSAGQKPTA